jgi:hypothetical protein
MKQWMIWLWAGGLCLQSMAQVNGFQPPTGYRAFSLNLPGGTVAISPSGQMAVARGQFGGGATITVYDRVKRQGRQIIATFQQAEWQFFGGLQWKDEHTLVFGENGDLDTIFQLNIQNGVASPLAPVGSLPDVADVLILGSETLALTASAPNANRLFRLSNGAALPLIDNYGTGYAAGLGFANGTLYLGDTNDPNFLGNPGQIWRYEPLFQNGTLTGVQFVDTVSLAGGNGAGLVSFAIDSEGDLIGSTQTTLTHLRGTDASPFGSFSGSFPFPTSVAYTGFRFEPFDGDGLLIVDGDFTGVGGLFALTPVPEPGTLLILSAGLLGLRVRRRK